MLIIYRKNDGEVFDQSSITSYPLGLPEASTVIEGVARTFGGDLSDYGVYRLDDNKEEAIVKKTFTHEFKIIDGKVVFGDQRNSFNLDEYKQSKLTQLKTQCEQSIESGFTATNGHTYRTNRDDQANFMGKKEYLNDHPDQTEVLWKTEDAGYISHTREEWFQVFYEGVEHKEAQLFKYDQLREQINNASTKEEVDSINW